MREIIYMLMHFFSSTSHMTQWLHLDLISFGINEKGSNRTAEPPASVFFGSALHLVNLRQMWWRWWQRPTEEWCTLMASTNSQTLLFLPTSDTWQHIVFLQSCCTLLLSPPKETQQHNRSSSHNTMS